MRYHTTTQLSENMQLTPEGYLLCIGVPIARTGALEYLREEVPEELAQSTSGSSVLVYRNAEDIFSRETMASYEGKDVTVDHPVDFVTPENWRDLTCGHSQNVRQGEGKDADLLLTDLLIKDQATIDLILPPEGGKQQEALREVSCGYDAEYELVAPGIGKQTNIRGNHIALVPHGRCGSRCKIKDKGQNMAKKDNWLHRIMGNPKVQKAMDEAAAEEKGKDQEVIKDTEKAEHTESQTATDSSDMAEKMDEILLILRSLVEAINTKDIDKKEAADIDPETKNNEAADIDPETKNNEAENSEQTEGSKELCKTGDKSLRRTADTTLIDKAKRLAPSMCFQIGDSVSMVKRASLRQAMADISIARVVNSCLEGSSLDSAPQHKLDTAFTVATELMRERANIRTGSTLLGTVTKDGKNKKPITPAEINRVNREFYDSQKR